jgi:alanine-glyoxylate transaminase/serine-glyoxylate transaminase/serine-pyruvate transaminase
MTTLPGQLNPPPRLLLGPGPSDAHPRVLAAMALPLVGHLDPYFLQIMNETADLLRQVYRTQNKITFPVSATGMAGMETCLVNLLEPGDKVVVCYNGFFSSRMLDIAGRTGATVTTLERPWGEDFSLDLLRETLQRVRPKVLAIVHAETSTGVRQQIEQLGKLCHEFDTLLVVDAVTSLGCIPVEVDAWEIDAIYSCSQKGLGCPPGLSPVSFSPRALDVIGKRKTKVQSWYLDVTTIQKYWSEDRVYHHTAPISMIYALREGLRLVLEEGLESRWQRHQLNHLALKAGLTALGLKYVAAEGKQLPQLNAVRIPEGVEDLPIRQRLLKEFSIEIGSGLGDFKGKVWRIGLMGFNSRPAVVLTLLGALEQLLSGTGLGVSAANAIYQKGQA